MSNSYNNNPGGALKGVVFMPDDRWGAFWSIHKTRGDTNLIEGDENGISPALYGKYGYNDPFTLLATPKKVPCGWTFSGNEKLKGFRRTGPYGCPAVQGKPDSMKDDDDKDPSDDTLSTPLLVGLGVGALVLVASVLS